MYSRLEMRLQSEYALSFAMSTLFHGVLMELMSEEEGERLHRPELHPYTQHLERREGNWYWVVTALNEEWCRIILKDRLYGLKEFVIRDKGCTVKIVEKVYREQPKRELTNHFYHEDAQRYQTLHFLTPTAFKQQGQYVFYPDIRCILQSLMNKYDATSETEKMADEETLEEMTGHTRIVEYNLRSARFDLEGVKVPGFIGTIKVKISGSQTMANLERLLFEFGEYSGAGIKTALGMGAMRIGEGRRRHDETADQADDRKPFA